MGVQRVVETHDFSRWSLTVIFVIIYVDICRLFYAVRICTKNIYISLQRSRCIEYDGKNYIIIPA